MQLNFLVWINISQHTREDLGHSNFELSYRMNNNEQIT